MLYAGEVVEHGPTASVFARPAHPYTAALLAARPGHSAAVSYGLPETGPAAANEATACRFADRCPGTRAVCRTAHPKLERLATGTRLVRCHFPLTSD